MDMARKFLIDWPCGLNLEGCMRSAYSVSLNKEIDVIEHNETYVLKSYWRNSFFGSIF